MILCLRRTITHIKSWPSNDHLFVPIKAPYVKPDSKHHIVHPTSPKFESIVIQFSALRGSSRFGRGWQPAPVGVRDGCGTRAERNLIPPLLTFANRAHLASPSDAPDRQAWAVGELSSAPLAFRTLQAMNAFSGTASSRRTIRVQDAPPPPPPHPSRFQPP